MVSVYHILHLPQLFSNQCVSGDDLSLHAALPVNRGEKWLANFWIWDPKRNH